jgi:Secretion system C-terminal sorting domain
MKKIIAIFATAIIGIQLSMAQCSSVVNDFEIRLLPTANNTLTIQMRHAAKANALSQSILPNSEFKLDGLVFAIAWPTTSNNIHFVDSKNAAAPFAIIADIPSANVSSKKAQDNFQTFFHNNTISLPTAFSSTWIADQWITIATLSYTGKLSSNDFFSLVTCDYGMAHPNSYSGNSTTDPWFAMITKEGKYVQYSPKMITELPSNLENNNTFSIYPNPASTTINVSIDINIATQVAVKIMDESGKIVKIIALELFAGKNVNSITISELASGNYIVHITDGKSIDHVQKMTKL